MPRTRRPPSQIKRLEANYWPDRKNFTKAERLIIIRDQKGLCPNLAEGCLKNINLSNCEIDHIQELADGGSNERSNLQGLCKDCHKFKTSISRLNRNLTKKEDKAEKSRQEDKAKESKIQEQTDNFIDHVVDDDMGDLYQIDPEAAYRASIQAQQEDPEIFNRKQMYKFIHFPPGNKIKVRYNRSWCNAIITQVNLLQRGLFEPEYTFNISYGLGEIEENVSYDRLRKMA